MYLRFYIFICRIFLNSEDTHTHTHTHIPFAMQKCNEKSEWKVFVIVFNHENYKNTILDTQVRRKEKGD